jgi:hypothetical protein
VGQVSQQQSIYNQVVQLTVSFCLLSSTFEAKLAAGRLKSSFDVLLKLHQVREYVRDPRRQITHLQKTPVKNKIESIRARLDRLGVEGSVTKDADEFKRRKGLFECVLSIRRNDCPP